MPRLRRHPRINRDRSRSFDRWSRAVGGAVLARCTGDHVAGQGNAESPGAGGASPSCAGACLLAKTLYKVYLSSQAAATARGMPHRKTKMKRLTALAIVIFASSAIASLGGQPGTSSTQVVTPPSGFFRPNEFETGAFGTFATGIGSGANSDRHAWGGGLDVTHWLPWKYGGIRFQGTGTNIR
jgi:hypothetical protein